MARTLWLDVAPGEGHEVTAIADDDRVVGQPRQQLAVDARGMDGIGIAREVVGVRGDGGQGARAQAACPFLDGQWIADLSREAEEERREVAGGARGQLAVACDLPGGVGDVDHRSGRIAEAAVAESEVERRADDHDQIGAGKRRSACARDQQGMVGREDAARHAVGDDRDAGGVGESARRRVGTVGPDIAAEHHDGSLGCAQQRGDVREIRLEIRWRRCGLARPRHRGGEEDVHGHVDEGRPAVRGSGKPEGRVHRMGNPCGIVHGLGGLGHGSKQRRMVDLLQCARPPAPIGSATSEEDEWRAVDPGAGDGAHSVGDARACRHGREAGRARELAHRLGGEDRGLLMAHVDEPHRACATALHGGHPTHGRVVEREDVRAGQREEVIGPVAGCRLDSLDAPVSGIRRITRLGHRMASASTLTPRATSATMAVTVMSVLFCTVLPSIPAGYRAR